MIKGTDKNRNQCLFGVSTPFLARVSKLGRFTLGLLLAYALAGALFGHFLTYSLRPSVLGFAVLSCSCLGIIILLRRPDWITTPLGKFLDLLSWKHIFLAALAIRLAWVLFSNVQQTSDFAGYDRMAREILDGKYIINPTKPTGASIFFSLHYLLMGYNPIFPQISIAILSTIQVVLVYSILVHVTSDRQAGLFGGLLLALWPEHILYTNLLGSDVLFSTAILTATWLLSIRYRTNWISPSVLAFVAGICLGIANFSIFLSNICQPQQIQVNSSVKSL